MSQKTKICFNLSSFKTSIPTYLSMLSYGIKSPNFIKICFNTLSIDSEITDFKKEPFDHLYPMKTFSLHKLSKKYIAIVLAPEPV